MSLRKRFAGVATGCAAMLVLSALPASAATRIVYDRPGDSFSGYDLTRTAFHNAPRRITVKAHVNGLKLERASFWFAFGPVSNPDLAFVAKTYLGRDGSRKTLQNLHVFREGPGPAPHVPCAVNAGWHIDLDYVRVSLPQSCIRDAAGPLGMRAIIFNSDNADIYDRTGWFTMRRG